MRRPWLAVLVDAAFVLLFAVVGRISHVEGVTLPGVLGTAWPFLVGLVAGWAAARALLRRWPREVGDALPVWLVTVAVGLLLRVVSGSGGAPWSFAVVATVVLGLFLVGWRCAAAVTAFGVAGLQRLAEDSARRDARR
jgi:hypothetical protein